LRTHAIPIPILLPLYLIVGLILVQLRYTGLDPVTPFSNTTRFKHIQDNAYLPVAIVTWTRRIATTRRRQTHKTRCRNPIPVFLHLAESFRHLLFPTPPRSLFLNFVPSKIPYGGRTKPREPSFSSLSLFPLDLARFWNVGPGSPLSVCSLQFFLSTPCQSSQLFSPGSHSMPVSPPHHPWLWSLDMSTPPERGFPNVSVPVVSAFSLAFPLSLCLNIVCTVQFKHQITKEMKTMK